MFTTKAFTLLTAVAALTTALGAVNAEAEMSQRMDHGVIFAYMLGPDREETSQIRGVGQSEVPQIRWDRETYIDGRRVAMTSRRQAIAAITTNVSEVQIKETRYIIDASGMIQAQGTTICTARDFRNDSGQVYPFSVICR